jgi:hypothetical protein
MLVGLHLENAAELLKVSIELSSQLRRRTCCGRTCAPRSLSGSLIFLVWPRKSTLITMGVSSVTGTLVVAMLASVRVQQGYGSGWRHCDVL